MSLLMNHADNNPPERKPGESYAKYMERYTAHLRWLGSPKTEENMTAKEKKIKRHQERRSKARKISRIMKTKDAK